MYRKPYLDKINFILTCKYSGLLGELEQDMSSPLQVLHRRRAIQVATLPALRIVLSFLPSTK